MFRKLLSRLFPRVRFNSRFRSRPRSRTGFIRRYDLGELAYQLSILELRISMLEASVDALEAAEDADMMTEIEEIIVNDDEWETAYSIQPGRNASGIQGAGGAEGTE